MTRKHYRSEEGTLPTVKRPAKEAPRVEVVEEASMDTEALEPERIAPMERRSSLTVYLDEIGQIPLINPEREGELALRIKRGDQSAREELITANLRLVVKIARDYEHVGLSLLDLINEGNIGLMKAVDRFDPTKGAKFSTYSSFWIKQGIKRALANQSKTIRLPVHMVDKIFHMRRHAARLQEELGREPTNEELAEEMGLTLKQIARMRRASMRPASLDARLGDDQSNFLGDVVPDTKAGTPGDILQMEQDTGIVRELVKQLPEREARILNLRFGLDGSKRLTLEEIGVRFKVTRERIRQLQNKALARLRAMLAAIDTQTLAA